MSLPPPPPFAGAPPPLPPGWTEHTAPAGQKYWFNPSTNISTYSRPLPPPPPPNWNPNHAPHPPPLAGPPIRMTGNGPPQSLPAAAAPAPTAAAKKEKREKPKDKIPVPGTDWVKVITNKGNVFYTNKETKASLWTVPEEIAAEVEAMEREASAPKKREREEEQPQEEEEGQAPKEEEDEAQDEPVDVVEEEAPAAEEDERPAERVEPAAAVEEAPKAKKQKRKVVREIEELESDEVWQRQMAEEMAKEAEAEAEAARLAMAEPAREEVAPKVEEANGGKSNGGQRAVWMDVTPEEGTAIFKAMLGEKDIQPMAPWDMELPKFVNDPRYQSVKLLKDRRDLFDEFCKIKIREQRAAKKAAGGVKVDPLVAYRALLQAEVTSTRTHFSDFKRAHAKDARFREFGKTEGEKEKVFRAWLRELGEKKRALAELAEREFGEMLAQDGEIKVGDRWVEVKGRHAKDKRYEGVNSSSLRESLFNKHVAALASGRPTASTSTVPAPAPIDPAATKADRAARAAASLREREEQVRLEQQRVSRSAQAARGALGREEAERAFTQLLIEKVRDHTVHWDQVVDSLRADERFDGRGVLSSFDQRNLFDAHTREMYAKRLAAVEVAFEQKSPLLTTTFDSIKDDLLELPQVTRIVGSDQVQLEHLYTSWLARRTSKARDEFQELLKESPVLEHWGRLQKQARGEEGAMEVKADEEDDEGDEQMPDLREMAGQVDVAAIERTLKHDKRYLIWDHEPEMRTRWVEEYLEKLAPPKATVHQKD